MTSTTRPRTGLRRILFPLLAVLGVCMLVVAAVAFATLRRPSVASRPTVLVRSPGQGAQVTVGEDVLFQAVARSGRGIARAELWVDGVLEAVQASAQPDGTKALAMVAQWRPPTPGAHTLTARAFDAQGARSHTSITVQAVAGPDGEGDGELGGDEPCPDETGMVVNPGCPEDDAPPAETPAAPAEADGDGDGVADSVDLCPGEVGPLANGGCPESGAPDGDGDGVADDVDLAPGEPGLPEHGGSPPPDADGDGDGIADEEEAPAPLAGFSGLILQAFRLLPPAPKALTLVEFQVLELRTHQAYDRVTCYACLGDGPAERVALEWVDGTAWQVPGELGLAGRQVQVAAEQPLTMTMQCGAYRSLSTQTPGDLPDGSFGDAGGDEAYYDLGSFAASHAQEEWDGRQRMAFSESADADAPGRIFHVNYRLCEGSCDESPLPPPSAGLFNYLDGLYLQWIWHGDPQLIDRFLVWCYDGSMPVATRTVGRDERRVYIGDLAPGCGRTRRFWVLAQRSSDGASSPASNTVEWEGKLCPGYLLVTFESVGDRSNCERGPIYGQFWANEEVLEFDASDNWWGNEHYRAGLGFPGMNMFGGCGFDIQPFFDDVRSLDAPWADSTYTAPASSRVYLPMDYDDDLTIGLRIYEDTPEGADPVLVEGSGTIPASHLLSEDFDRSYGGDPYAAGPPEVGVIFMGFDSEGSPFYNLVHSNGLLTIRLQWSGRPQAP